MVDQQESAGVLLWRRPSKEGADRLEVLLVHPGGPYWRNKDLGAWTLPKGVPDPGEPTEAAARREFAEETGQEVAGPLMPLGRVRQRAGKWVEGFAAEGDFDPARLTSNSFEIEWPPRSGRRQSFPEVDRAQWFTLDEARLRINPAQVELIDRLHAALERAPAGGVGPCMAKPKPPAAERASKKQIARNARRGGPKTMKRAKHPGARGGQKG